MNEKIKDFIFVFVCVLVGFTSGYFACAREYGERVDAITRANQQLSTNLDATRSALDRAVTRSAIAERGLAEAINSLGTIQERNKRITVLVDAIRATIGQLRAIVEDGTKATESVANNSDG